MLLFLLEFGVKIPGIFDLLLLMLHHVEEFLGVDLTISSCSFPEKLLEVLIFCLELPNQFILRTLIDNCLVLDLLSTIGIPQR